MFCIPKRLHYQLISLEEVLITTEITLEEF